MKRLKGKTATNAKNGWTFWKKEYVWFGVKIKLLELAAAFLIIFLFFLTRLYRLADFPVFCDEAIYVRWSQIMRSEPSLRFLPLSDGKQPLFMWLTIPFLKFVADPLVAGRLVSVAGGFLSLVALGIASWLLFRKKSLVLWTALVYTVVPFTLFFDRLALVDSLLSGLGIASLGLSWQLAKTPRLDLALIWGAILGFALLTKSPAVFFILLSGFSFLAGLWRPKVTAKKIAKTVILFMVGLVISFSIYNILRLGPNFHMIALRNRDYVWSLGEILRHPLDPLLPHLTDVARYYYFYLTLPVLLLGVMGIVVLIKRKEWRSILTLVAWWLGPLLAQAAVAKVLTARYVLFALPPFLIFIGVGTEFFWQQLHHFFSFSKTVLIIILFGMPSLIFAGRLLGNFTAVPLPADERKGYLQDWTSGWGIKAAAKELRETAKTNQVVVGTEGYFGTLPDGLQIYTEGIPNLTVIGVGYPIKGIPEPLANAKKSGDRVFLVVNRSRLEIVNNLSLVLRQEYVKPGGDSLLLLEVTGKNEI